MPLEEDIQQLRAAVIENTKELQENTRVLRAIQHGGGLPAAKAAEKTNPLKDDPTEVAEETKAAEKKPAKKAKTEAAETTAKVEKKEADEISNEQIRQAVGDFIGGEEGPNYETNRAFIINLLARFGVKRASELPQSSRAEALEWIARRIADPSFDVANRIAAESDDLI